jgi:hypothetical protein
MVYFTETRPIVVVSGGALDERVGTACSDTATPIEE